MRIALIGNCQVQTLAVLAGQMSARSTVRVFDYSEAYSRDEARRAAFAESLDDVDFIFCQTALFSHTCERDLRPRYGDKVVTIGNFYFRGLFPDSCNVGDFHNRLHDPTSMHSLLVLDAYRRGLSEAQALAGFSIEGFARLGLLDAWESSMAELRLREANGQLDVPAADLIERACRTYPAFLTMNHPGIGLLADYWRMVLKHVGLTPEAINPFSIPDPLAAHDTTPIHDEVAAYLRLPYRSPQYWKINAFGATFCSRADYVSACYAAYSLLEDASLVAHSPTDLVAALKASGRLAYLADAQAPLPDDAGNAGVPGRPTPNIATLLARSEKASGMLLAATDEIKRSQAALQHTVLEMKQMLHTNHSYLQVMDPKVERIDKQRLPELAALVAALPAAAPAPPRLRAQLLALARTRRAALAAACIGAGIIVGGVFGALIL